MHFVLLAEHNAEVCPMSNAKTRDLLLKLGPEIPNIAQKNGVTFVAGPYVNREHIVVAVVDSDSVDKVDKFLVESRLESWNRVRVLPSKTIQEGFEEVQAAESLF